MSLLELSQLSTQWTIWLGLLGSTLFTVVFITRPWRKYRVTRGYFFATLAMNAIFLRSAMLLYERGLRPGVEDPVWVSVSSIALNAFVLWTIWYQLIAIVVEIRYGKRGYWVDDPVSGNR